MTRPAIRASRSVGTSRPRPAPGQPMVIPSAPSEPRSRPSRWSRARRLRSRPMSAGQVLVVGAIAFVRRRFPQFAHAARHGRATAVRMAAHGRGRRHEAAPHGQPLDGPRQAGPERRRRTWPQLRLGGLVRRAHDEHGADRVVGRARPPPAAARRAVGDPTRPADESTARRPCRVPTTVAPLRTPTAANAVERSGSAATRWRPRSAQSLIARRG